MLQVIKISGDITFTYEMHTSAAAYVLGKHASITTIEPDALLQLANVSNGLITIAGQIQGGAADLDTGIALHGSQSTVVIAKTGRVEASTGIEVSSGGHVIENHGLVTANDRAVWLQGDGLVENYGRLHGDEHGVISGGVTSVQVVNHKGGVISSDITAITFNGDANTASTLLNEGLIKSNGTWAYFSVGGSETVTNHGIMKGAIWMGDGNDTFDNRGGTVDHDILGQVGNDTLYTDDANVHLQEEFGQGNDTVKSTVGYTLSDNVENLFLLGGADINGKGTDVQNVLVGNKGENTLKGLGGADILNGGAGNDILIGGADLDVFILVKHGGHDVVADFSFAEDVVNLAGQSAIADYADLIANHIHESHGDLEIRLNAKDTLLLENTDMDDISSTNFLF